MACVSRPRVLTIAGSDSGAGAGVQADLKTIAALGGYGTCAITAVTAQNTLGVTGVCRVDAATVRAQVDAVMDDIGADAAKTGMLWDAEIIETVAGAVRARRIGNLVVDPVMVATSGARLLRADAERAQDSVRGLDVAVELPYPGRGDCQPVADQAGADGWRHGRFAYPRPPGFGGTGVRRGREIRVADAGGRKRAWTRPARRRRPAYPC